MSLIDDVIYFQIVKIAITKGVRGTEWNGKHFVLN